jgi:hypothetical protein
VKLTADQIATLAAEKVLDIGGGVWLTVDLMPDNDLGIAEFHDCYGQIAHIPRGRREDPRPAWFTGAARKIWTHSECFWWQPPDGIVYDLGQLQQTVKDILEYGFLTIEVRRWHKCGECGNACEDIAYLGGVEPFPTDEALADYLPDMVWELLHDLAAV